MLFETDSLNFHRVQTTTHQVNYQFNLDIDFEPNIFDIKMRVDARKLADWDT